MPSFYSNNQLPSLADGGEIDGPDYTQPDYGAEPQQNDWGHPEGDPLYVAGQSDPHVRGPGGGRDDKIPAMLDDGEYVMDSELVSLLGDGDNDVGARRLDQLREHIRQHKGKALARGDISPKAPPVGALARYAMNRRT
jgi:hypothetical protein